MHKILHLIFNIIIVVHGGLLLNKMGANILSEHVFTVYVIYVCYGSPENELQFVVALLNFCT